MSFLKTIGQGITSALGGGIVGLGADIIGGAFGNRARRKEADRAFERSKQMFDYQNQYNTPARQMERLKEAGLNPALMYGQGTTGNAQGYPQQAPAQQMNVAGANSIATALMMANVKKTQAETDDITGNTKEAKARISRLNAQKDLLSEQALKTAQETDNLVTTGELLALEEEMKSLEKQRMEKGFIKGDTIGNLVTMLGYDPVNNQMHRDLLRTLLIGKFGAQIAKDLLSAYINARTGGKVKQTTIYGAPSYNNYSGQNPFNQVKPKG